MFPASSPDPAAMADALLDWWRLAGVDHSFRGEAEAWLRPQPSERGQSAKTLSSNVGRTASSPAPQGEGPAPPDEPSPSPLGDPAAWPTELEAFRSWWLAEPALGEPGAFPRVEPTGPLSPRLMVIVPEPEEEDRAGLLSGPDGAMLRDFLRAAGVDGADCYVASALPRHTPLVDWSAVAARGMGAVLAHHVKLVQPRRVMAFGRRLGSLTDGFNALLAPGLDELRRSSKARERMWRKWLNWTGDDPR